MAKLNESIPNTHSALTFSLTSFLTVVIHQILYLRSVYPRHTFLPVRSYNYPVRQSRHPKVCTWISDAASAVQLELLKCTVSTVSVVIYSVRTNQPLEKYTFDLSQMPRVPLTEIHTEFERRAEDEPSPTNPGSPVDLEAQFRAVLARLASACARLTPLPQDEECSFTVCIDLRDDAEAPAGRSKEDAAWIAGEPGKLDITSTSKRKARMMDEEERNAGVDGTNEALSATGSRRRAKTVPVRRVDAGEMKLEVWVEEAKGKFEELDRIDFEYSQKRSRSNDSHSPTYA